MTLCVPCFSVPCLVNGSDEANGLSGICRERVPQKTDPSGKMIRVGEMFWLSLENCQSAENRQTCKCIPIIFCGSSDPSVRLHVRLHVKSHFSLPGPV